MAAPTFGPAANVDPDEEPGESSTQQDAPAPLEALTPADDVVFAEPTLFVPETTDVDSGDVDGEYSDADTDGAAVATPRLSLRARLSSNAAARRAKRLGVSDTAEEDAVEEPDDAEELPEPDEEDDDAVVFVDPSSWGVATVLDDDDDVDPTSMRGAFQMSRRAERESDRAARRAERDTDTEAAVPVGPQLPEHELIDWEALGLPEPIPPAEAVPARPWV